MLCGMGGKGRLKNNGFQTAFVGIRINGTGRRWFLLL